MACNGDASALMCDCSESLPLFFDIVAEDPPNGGTSEKHDANVGVDVVQAVSDIELGTEFDSNDFTDIQTLKIFSKEVDNDKTSYYKLFYNSAMLLILVKIHYTVWNYYFNGTYIYIYCY